MKKQTPQERYRAKSTKQFNLVCYMATEQDIIKKLETVENRNGYIKNLIRSDLSNRG